MAPRTMVMMMGESRALVEPLLQMERACSLCETVRRFDVEAPLREELSALYDANVHDAEGDWSGVGRNITSLWSSSERRVGSCAPHQQAAEGSGCDYGTYV